MLKSSEGRKPEPNTYQSVDTHDEYDPIDTEQERRDVANHQRSPPPPRMSMTEVSSLPPPIRRRKKVCCSTEMCLFLLSYLALILVGGLVYRDLKRSQMREAVKLENMESNILDLQERYDRLSIAFDEYKKNELAIETTFQNDVNILSNTVAAHSVIVNRLSNMTTNADVLDKLKETSERIDLALTATKSDVSQALEETRLNVTYNLAMTSRELRATQEKVQGELSTTLETLNEVVVDATTNIHQVQNNVTLQLASMTDTLDVTVEHINELVQHAQETIHQEVAGVKANIDEYVAVTNKQFAAENDFVKYQLAGTFTLLGCLISLWHLTSHMRHYFKPDVQRRVMAVLWMVPIYGVTSWLSLVFPKFEHLFGSFRDCYEAYAVYTFIAFLIAVLDDGQGLSVLINKLANHVVEERMAIDEAIAKKARLPKEHLKPPFPCCYVWHRPTTVATAWLYQCQLMGLQFVMAKPLLALIPFVVKIAGIPYDDVPPVSNNHINWHSPKLWVTVCQNLSVATAFYGLLSLYHGTEKDLAWCDPWPKFLCIKGVVFMTFWQVIVTIIIYIINYYYICILELLYCYYNDIVIVIIHIVTYDLSTSAHL